MSCEDRDKTICEVKASFIRQEVDNSFEHIKSQKTLAFNAIKIYLVVLYIMMFYIFLGTAKMPDSVNEIIGKSSEDVKISLQQDTSLRSSKNPTEAPKNITQENKDDIVHWLKSNAIPLGGITFTIFVFALGWAMLSYLSHIIAGIRKSYRHINSMRGFKASIYGGLNAFSIMPTAEQDVTPIYSSGLPRTFAVINFLILYIVFYFLCFLTARLYAFVITMSVVFVISLFYIPAIRNFYLTIEKADLIRPMQKMEYIQTVLEEAIAEVKKGPAFEYMSFKSIHRLRWLIALCFLLSLLYFFYRRSVDLDQLSITAWLPTAFFFFAFSTISLIEDSRLLNLLKLKLKNVVS